MTSKRFERLVESLDDVRTHVATGRFAGRKIEVAADDIRAVRQRSGALGVAPPRRSRMLRRPRGAA